MVISLLLVTIIIRGIGQRPAPSGCPVLSFLLTIWYNSSAHTMSSGCVPLWPGLPPLTPKGRHSSTKCLIVRRKFSFNFIISGIWGSWKHGWRCYLSSLKSHLCHHFVDVFSTFIGIVHSILAHVEYALHHSFEFPALGLVLTVDGR
jgi:hypothetical protein